MKTLVKTLPLNDGTIGIRFDVVGIKGLKRKRIIKRRWGMSVGKTFRAIHIGKTSVYIQRFKTKRPVGDWALRNMINAYKLAFKY